jgi:pimeloyl-ACP methyl ester carboxylesterase
MSKKFTNNNGISIEYYSLNNDMSSIPLVIIPGAIVGAGDIVEGTQSICNIKTFVISIRGRGESSKPTSGYSMNDQISDIEAVIKAEVIHEFYIFGHSVGAGISSGYAVKHPEQVKGLILGDYPPGYPKFTAAWAENIRKNFEGISENLVNGLLNESEKKYFLNELAEFKIKTLILKSGGGDSLLSIENAQKINSALPNSNLVILNNCGHEMFNDDPKEVFDEVKKFMDTV